MRSLTVLLLAFLMFGCDTKNSDQAAAPSSPSPAPQAPLGQFDGTWTAGNYCSVDLMTNIATCDIVNEPAECVSVDLNQYTLTPNLTADHFDGTFDQSSAVDVSFDQSLHMWVNGSLVGVQIYEFSTADSLVMLTENGYPAAGSPICFRQFNK